MTERRLRALRLLARPAILGALALLLIMPDRGAAAAGFPPAFVVAGVPVDASADTAPAARDAARNQGEQAAFRRLLQRLTAPADWSRLPTLDQQTLSGYLVDVQVADERSSSVRYLANLTFRFSPKGVRTLLRGAGIPFTELVSKPVVVVPMLDGAADGPWRDAWNAAPGQYGLVPWVVADAAAPALDPAQPRPDQILALSQRYDLADVVVVAAHAAGSHLDLTVTRYGAQGGSDSASTAADGTASQSPFQAGVLAAQAVLENQWKKEVLTASGGGDQVFEVRVPIAGPGDWARISQRLSRVAIVRSTRIDLMTRSEVRLHLVAVGDPSVVRVALAQQDLELTPGEPYGVLALRAGALTEPSE